MTLTAPTPDSPTVAQRIPVVDVDAHISEPPDLWTSRLPEKYQDIAPRVVQLPVAQDGGPEDVWTIGDQPIVSAWQFAIAGYTDFFPAHPSLQSEAHPGSYDSFERLKVMDEHGISRQVLYPNLLAFYQPGFLRVGDAEFHLSCVRAYNDFLTDFASAAPDRLVPISVLPVWDIEASIAEMQRCAELGHRGILFSNSPDKAGLPILRDPHWHRLFAAAQEARMPVNFHVAAGTVDENLIAAMAPGKGVAQTAADTAKQTTLGLLSNAAAIVEVIFSGLCERFPELDFISVESGYGYVPYLIETMDWQWLNNGAAKAHPERLKPSEYFRRQVYSTFWFEHQTLSRLIEDYEDNVMFESDFPHPTCLAPGPASFADTAAVMIEQNLSGLPERTLRKVLHDNAARVYRLDQP
jgi:predicted TIM-barrel fold metal-dependent hydrolase